MPNRSSPPATLFRESNWLGGKVQNRTLANLTAWPAEQITALRLVLTGEILVAADEVFKIERSLPHGHVAAVLGTLRNVGDRAATFLFAVLPKLALSDARLTSSHVSATIVEAS